MPKIFGWKCSYYKNEKRRWAYGKLDLHINGISFLEDSTSVKKKVTVNFSSINEVKKTTSSFIYSCVFIRTDIEKLWFSSFLNRDNVFNTIEHFWKEQLYTSKIPVRLEIFYQSVSPNWTFMLLIVPKFGYCFTFLVAVKDQTKIY